MPHYTLESSGWCSWFWYKAMQLVCYSDTIYFQISLFNSGSQDGSVSIVNRLWAGWVRYQGSVPNRINRFVSSLRHPDQLWDPSSFLSNWYWVLCPEVRPLGVKQTTHLHLVLRLRLWSYASAPAYVFEVWCLVMRRDNCHFMCTLSRWYLIMVV
jgi:hypothetical protein